MSASPRGAHARDTAVPPPVDPELTRLSLRWTNRALVFVIGMWASAAMAGAYFDAMSRYPFLTWIVLFGGRGSGAVWESRIPRGDLAVFAMVVVGLAVIPALVGAVGMWRAAQDGRPHRGPSRWSVAGVVVAAGLGPNVIGCFVLSEVYSPWSGNVVIAGFAPVVLGLSVGAFADVIVRYRYDPWRWVGRDDDARAPRAPRAQWWTRTGPRMTRIVEELVLGERPPAGAARPRAARAVRANSRRVVVTPAGVSWRTRFGRSGSIPSERIGRVCGAEVTSAGSPTALYAYALVLDLDGAVLLRVSAMGGGAVASADRMRGLREMWAPLDVLVTRHPSILGRTKDFRRCWPEAFAWPVAYPILSAVVASALWVAAGLLIDSLAHP